jgi:hypothetical protein
VESNRYGYTQLLIKISNQVIELYKIVFGRAGGSTYDIPYSVLLSSLSLESMSIPNVQITKFNDAYLLRMEYLLIDYIGIVPQANGDS